MVLHFKLNHRINVNHRGKISELVYVVSNRNMFTIIICLSNISNVFLYAYKSAQETNWRLYQNDGNLIIFFWNQINITSIRLLKLLEIIESLHCIIEHLISIRTAWYQPKIFKSIFFIMCMIGMNNCWSFMYISLQRCSTKSVFLASWSVSVEMDSITSLNVKVTAYFTQITVLNKSYHFDEKTN